MFNERLEGLIRNKLPPEKKKVWLHNYLIRTRSYSSLFLLDNKYIFFKDDSVSVLSYS